VTYCLQRANWCLLTQHYFAFTLRETSKDCSLCHSCCCSWKQVLSLPLHTLWGRQQSPSCKHSRGILPHVIAVGNLINASMPLLALTCQMSSWYHHKSHRNEWSDWGLRVRIPRALMSLPGAHGKLFPKWLLWQLCSRTTVGIRVRGWALLYWANTFADLSISQGSLLIALQEDNVLFKPFLY